MTPDVAPKTPVTKFRKSSGNPVVPRRPGTFHAVHAANPDLVLFRDKMLLLYRGQDERGHDEIGVAVNEGPDFNAMRWLLPKESAIKVGPNPKAFDSGHILDPAGLPLDDRLFVYYTAHRVDWDSWNIPSYVGLATSMDGETFEKRREPVIEGMAPEAVLHGGRVHLVFQRLTGKNSFSFYIAESQDGIHFEEAEGPILTPSGVKGSFDSHSISTARIWREGEWYLMAYGGCRRFTDYPEAIGLARSRNLRQWERYPGNPVLRRGRAGAWDEGAVWFATGYRFRDTTYLFYEGVGRFGNARKDRSLAPLCRHTDYGGYARIAFSQIGLAQATGSLANW